MKGKGWVAWPVGAEVGYLSDEQRVIPRGMGGPDPRHDPGQAPSRTGIPLRWLKAGALSCPATGIPAKRRAWTC
jgi:hypothetical protein